MRKTRRFVLAAVVALQAGCGGTESEVGHPFLPGRLVYAPVVGLGPDTSNGVCVVQADLETGALELVPGSPYWAGRYPEAVVAHPSGRFVYVGDTVDRVIYPFSVEEATGALSRLAPTGFSGYSPRQMVMTPSGRFLYVLGAADSDIPLVGAFSVDPSTGLLSAVPGSPFVVPTETPKSYFSNLGIDPRGRFLLVGHHMSKGRITAFAVDGDTGALSAMPGVPTPVGTRPLRRMAFAPSGRFVYVGSSVVVSSGVMAGGVWGFALDPSGSLSPTPGSPYLVNSSFLQALTLTPAGDFLLVAGANADFHTLRVDPNNGSLSIVESSVQKDVFPIDLIMDPLGRQAYLADFRGSIMTVAVDSATGHIELQRDTMVLLTTTADNIAVSP